MKKFQIFQSNSLKVREQARNQNKRITDLPTRVMKGAPLWGGKTDVQYLCPGD